MSQRSAAARRRLVAPRLARLLPTLPIISPPKNLFLDRNAISWGPADLAACARNPAQPQSISISAPKADRPVSNPAGPSPCRFSFPTPSLARQQLPEFQKIPEPPPSAPALRGRRPGPAALSCRKTPRRELSRRRRRKREAARKAARTQTRNRRPDVLSILTLAGLLLAFCLLSGLAVGGTLRLARRFGYSAAEGRSSRCISRANNSPDFSTLETKALLCAT